MVRFIAAAILAVMLYCGPAFAQEGFGVGVIIGEPTGLSFKGWLDGSTAIAGAAAWSFGRHDSLHMHADYLVHKYGVFRAVRGKLPVYYGIGARVKFDEPDTRFGIRIPVGISYLFGSDPLDVFLEIAPVVDIAPATDVNFNGGLGIRYYFR